MKKIFYTLLYFMLIGLTACTEDDSTLATVEVGDITISNLEDSYSVRSYVGENLKDYVAPTIETTYAENDLSYAWYLFDSNASDIDYKDYLISNDKVPDYEVSLASGDYTLAFEVKAASTEYAQFATTTLHTSTNFSRGFYILKETADGNTDIDCYNEELMSDIIAGNTGASLQGKPYNLSILYNGEYVNPDNDEMAYENFVHITTESGDYKGFRSEDMREIFNRDNLFYSGAMDANEKPCGFIGGMMYMFYLSNTGIRSYLSSMAMMGDAANTGKLGFPTCEESTTKFIQTPSYFGGFAYWSDTNHWVMLADYNFASASPMTDTGGNDLRNDYPADLKCLASGLNSNGGINLAWFLCESPSSGQRYLFKLEDLMMSIAIGSITAIDPASHLAKSTAWGGNGLTASYIYCVDDNKLYAYSLQNDNSELEISLPGIPAGESLAFVTNQYLNLEWMDSSYNFDNFIVGTQNGDTYKLYFYEEEQMNGGQPITEPAYVVEGTGKVKSVRFLSPQKDISGMNLSMITNPYPLSD